jgi:hypothetical protein
MNCSPKECHNLRPQDFVVNLTLSSRKDNGPEGIRGT